MIGQRIGNRGIDLGTLFDRAAARHPDTRITLLEPLPLAPTLPLDTTVERLADAVADIADRLHAAGVSRGDRVVVHKRNSFDISLAACAIVRVGALPVLLSPALDGATVAGLIARVSTARLDGATPSVAPYLLTDTAALRGNLAGHDVGCLVSGLLLAEGEYPGATALHGLDPGVRRAPVRSALHAPTLVTHTSGTTGLPKLAVHTNFGLQARYRPQAAASALARRRGPVVMHVSYVHSRLFTFVAIALLRGFPLAVLDTDDPAVAGELFTRLRPIALEAHPNSFMRWEELADDPRRPLASVRYFSSTFDAIHPRTVRRLLGASDQRRPLFVQLYGQSETGPTVVSWFSRRSVSDARGRRVGRPFPLMTAVRVVSRDGRPATAASPGFIEVRTDGRVRTYLGEDERYAQQLDDGWWRMGDLGYLTRGALHLLDREVDEIPGLGSTLAVEDRLFAAFPELTEVVIVPDGARALPIVCTRGDRPIDPQRWAQAVAALPLMSPPRHVRLDELPQTATTKVKRLELARTVAAARPAAPTAG